MNATSRAIIQTVLRTDPTLSASEQAAMQCLVDGEVKPLASAQADAGGRLLVSQKRAAEMLSVSRVTIWRMTREALLHPVEILPGTWRYLCDEIQGIARHGTGAGPTGGEARQRSAA